MSIADFNLTYVTPLLEKLNKEEKLCFLIGDFNIKFDNSQFYDTVCS